MTQPTVLISGAGIAGPTLAFWLNQYGYRVIVVEIAPQIRPGGQTVDLRGAGRAVVERMGLTDQMRARCLDQRGIAWVTTDGRRRAEMPVEAFQGNGVVSKHEILRGDMADVLYQVTRADSDYRFGTHITQLSQSAEFVAVTLSDGTTVHADLVVGADGTHSAVRRLLLGPEEQFVRPVGGYNAWFTAFNIRLTALAMKYMQRWPFRRLAEQKFFTSADAVDLPDYAESPASARRA
jgi:2-polyprenyl-6-methoxyphenol hydroxylase-like FAD-dependent oxidoreductase